MSRCIRSNKEPKNENRFRVVEEFRGVHITSSTRRDDGNNQGSDPSGSSESEAQSSFMKLSMPGTGTQLEP
jgi:hypothetical protein